MSISSARQIKKAFDQDALIKALVDFVEITPQARIRVVPGSAVFIAEYPYIVEFEAVWDIRVVGLTGDDLVTVLEAAQAKVGGDIQGNQLKVKTFATEDLIDSARKGQEALKQEKVIQEAVAKIGSVRDGKDGAVGPQGAPGERGPQGPQGPAGRDGRDGRDGKDLVATEAKLDDLQDVAVSTAKKGNVLMYDGDSWVARYLEQRSNLGGGLTESEITILEGLQEGGEPMGFSDRADSTLSFDNATRTFTITPVGDSFTVWVKAKRFTIREPKSVQIPNTTGLYFIYFDEDGELGQQTDYFYWDREAPTAYVYWDAGASICPYLAEERHGIVLDWQAHEYLHRTRGSVLASGFGIFGYVLNGTGASDSDAQFSLAGGTFFDEDLEIQITHSETPDPNLFQQDLQGPAELSVVYKIGNTWKFDAATNFAFKKGPTHIYYNTQAAGVWGLTETENNKYVNYYVVATHNLKAPVIALMSQGQHVNITDAQSESFSALNLSGFPSKEFRFLYKIIYRVGNYGNSVKAIIASVQDLRTYSDQFVPALDIGSIRIDQLAEPNTTVSFGNQRISNLATPVNSLDATNKTYVDSAVQTLTSRLNNFRDSNRIYVAKNGNDSNNGTSLGEPLLTLGAAAAAAQPGDIVFVGPGTYVEPVLPLRWKRDVSVYGSGLRNTIVQPAAGQEYNDIFKVDSGFWCWGISFAGHQADSALGLQSWAISFDELANNTSIGASGLGAYIQKSPYIQNCTSITAEDDAGIAGSTSTGDTGGGINVDGSKCANNSPIRSMVVDSYTQVNLGGPGCLVQNDGYAQLVSFFGTFCTYHVKTLTGGQVNLSGGGTTDFGTYGLVADGYSPSPLYTAEARTTYFGASRIDTNVTIDVATAVFTANAHGLNVNDQVQFSATNGSLPTGLSSSTIYYVISSGLTANNFKVSTTSGGSSVSLSGTATGTYRVVRQGVLTVDLINFSNNRFTSSASSRPVAGQIMFPQLVFPRNASTKLPEAKTFAYTRLGDYSLSFTEAASPSGPEHQYVSGGTAVIGGTNYGVAGATYNKTTGVVTLTTTQILPAGDGNVTVDGLNFICPTSAYIILSSVPIDASGNEVPNSSPSRAGYRVNFFNELNGGLINPLSAAQKVDFRTRSLISAPSHTFEYVGAGTNYSALPWNGGIPVPANAIVETNNGRVYSSNTNEKGDFAVGSQFSVDGTTGSVTINTDQFNLSGLNFIGPFSRNGGFSTVGVQLQEVSNNSTLNASTGAPDGNTVPTQFAVKEYTGQRYMTNVTVTAGQPISVSGAAGNDGAGNWTFERNISLQLNNANGLLRLDGSALIPANLFPTNLNLQTNSVGVGTAASGVAGEIRATNNITAYYSDDRLKTKLGSIENAIDIVEKLSGFYYEANKTAQELGYKAVREIGVSAQEVQAVVPEAVAPAPIDDKYLTVRYERLVPVLIEAIKELSEKVAELEAKLNDN